MAAAEAGNADEARKQARHSWEATKNEAACQEHKGPGQQQCGRAALARTAPLTPPKPHPAPSQALGRVLGSELARLAALAPADAKNPRQRAA